MNDSFLLEHADIFDSLGQYKIADALMNQIVTSAISPEVGIVGAGGIAGAVGGGTTAHALTQSKRIANVMKFMQSVGFPVNQKMAIDIASKGKNWPTYVYRMLANSTDPRHRQIAENIVHKFPNVKTLLERGKNIAQYGQGAMSDLLQGVKQVGQAALSPVQTAKAIGSEIGKGMAGKAGEAVGKNLGQSTALGVTQQESGKLAQQKATQLGQNIAANITKEQSEQIAKSFLSKNWGVFKQLSGKIFAVLASPAAIGLGGYAATISAYYSARKIAQDANMNDMEAAKLKSAMVPLAFAASGLGGVAGVVGGTVGLAQAFGHEAVDTADAFQQAKENKNRANSQEQGFQKIQELKTQLQPIYQNIQTLSAQISAAPPQQKTTLMQQRQAEYQKYLAVLTEAQKIRQEAGLFSRKAVDPHQWARQHNIQT